MSRLPGVNRVENGFYGPDQLETNTVYYDPSRITVGEMEDALKRAGTYRETLRTKR